MEQNKLDLDYEIFKLKLEDFLKDKDDIYLETIHIISRKILEERTKQWHRYIVVEVVVIMVLLTV